MGVLSVWFSLLDASSAAVVLLHRSAVCRHGLVFLLPPHDDDVRFAVMGFLPAGMGLLFVLLRFPRVCYSTSLGISLVFFFYF